ncbi:type III PLP-dependent enzyme [uncultured Pseudoteredinibacter sp.]|uniref:type III PLP-dependent enzyme n=1 Tax=uncultured Pseudoteredinibacter sp. TaxID=1641701 RepID=UPI00263811F8|nr:type III PLP-dependent enzyme [uncultured Pseudoteredinibacter sp.]
MNQYHPFPHSDNSAKSQSTANPLQSSYSGPKIIIDSAMIRRQAKRFAKAMPRVQAHYAVKANPHPEVLRTLQNCGVNFEIASRKELEMLLALGVDPKSVFYSNPFKGPQHLSYAVENGVQWYVVDCIEEMEKVLSAKPDASLYLRLYTTNKGSLWPLSSKFGAATDEVVPILERAVELKADLAGVTFHVGSQCTNTENWQTGIREAKACFETMRNMGLKPRLLNLGGGYPMQPSEIIENPTKQQLAPSIEAIADVINTEIADLPDDIQIIAEPGRYMVAEAGRIICQVIGTTKRGDDRWAYVDAGFYHGLMELTDAFDTAVTSNHSDEDEQALWTFGGPTCDSIDVFGKGADGKGTPLSAKLQTGDFITLHNTGAYVHACGTEFNGFEPLEVVVI